VRGVAIVPGLQRCRGLSQPSTERGNIMGHTKGPWTQSGWTIYYDATEHPKPLAECYSDYCCDIAKDTETRFKSKLSKVNEREAQANARLIAAAPELLEACEQMLISHSAPEWCNCGACNMSRRAIKKARGS